MRYLRMLFLAASAAFFMPAYAGGYLDLELAVHDAGLDQPEIQGLRNPLGIVEAGYERGPLAVYVRHMSSIPTDERGYGLNTVGIRLRVLGD